jgi:HK97 gp10 family phage protein
MPTGASIRIDDAELRRQLKRLEGVAGERVLRSSLRAGATPIRKAAKENAPRRTGELADSIKTRTKKDKAYGFLAYVLAGAWYAHFPEFGVKPHFQKRSKRFGGRTKRRVHPGHAAQPYLRPAFDEKKDEAVGTVRTKLRAAIARLTGVSNP